MDANVARHDLIMAASRNGLLYHCRQGCGRQLLVRRATGGLTVLDRGDPWALHTGGSSGIELRVDLPQP